MTSKGEEVLRLAGRMYMIKNEVAIFGGGCFWCTEAVYKILRGIESVVPGYAGGPSTGSGYKPTYEEVSTGTTGHAEVIKIEYDPEQISYRDLLTIFFATHDPTQLNRQGNDVGTQYRSIILHANNQQKEAAEKFIEELELASTDGGHIVTEVKPLTQFYEAEDYHHDYYAKNKSKNPYCQIVINPKLKKVQEKFAEMLKK